MAILCITFHKRDMDAVFEPSSYQLHVYNNNIFCSKKIICEDYECSICSLVCYSDY
jgi:hypothetical protein